MPECTLVPEPCGCRRKVGGLAQGRQRTQTSWRHRQQGADGPDEIRTRSQPVFLIWSGKLQPVPGARWVALQISGNIIYFREHVLGSGGEQLLGHGIIRGELLDASGRVHSFRSTAYVMSCMSFECFCRKPHIKRLDTSRSCLQLAKALDQQIAKLI